MTKNCINKVPRSCGRKYKGETSHSLISNLENIETVCQSETTKPAIFLMSNQFQLGIYSFSGSKIFEI